MNLNVIGLKLAKAKAIIWSRLPIIDRNPRNKTVFLAGTARSGTTWVADIINYNNDYRVMFEPFNPDRMELVKNFQYRQYLRADNCDEKYIKPTDTILSGQFRNVWVNQINRKLVVRKRLIKDIRTNLLLKWIKTHFPDVPVILLLRHPCAVAHSRLKLNWDPRIERLFLSQKELLEDYLESFVPEIKSANTAFEKNIFVWCMENYIPLKQFKKGEIHVAFYENFCTQPEQEIKNLLSFLGETYHPKALRTVSKPSLLCRKQSPVVLGKNRIGNFKKHFTNQEIQRAMEILNLFGLDQIYDEEPLPLVTGPESLSLF